MSFLAFNEYQKISITELALIFEGASIRILKSPKKFIYGSNRIQELEKMVGQSNQESLIELQDRVEMLNRRFFNKSKESL